MQKKAFNSVLKGRAMVVFPKASFHASRAANVEVSLSEIKSSIDDLQRRYQLSHV